MEKKTRKKPQNTSTNLFLASKRSMAFVYCGGIITGIHRQAPKALQEPKTLSKDKSHFSKQPLTFPQSFVDT